MTTEIQPRERLPFYIPENWLPLDPAEGGQQFVNYPTAQTANISFPGAILCSNLESFAPSAPMNLFNNSTTGDIQIANTFGYTGGIVMSADGIAPVDGKIIIGDSARALVAPLIETNVLQGNGLSFIDVNSDLQVNNTLYANDIEPIGKFINLGSSLDITINIGGNIIDDNINLGASMTAAGNINLGGALGITNAANLESSLISCKTNNALSIGTFAGRTTDINIGTGMTSGNINLGGANGTTNAQKLESGLISCAGNAPLSIGTFAGRTRNIDIGTGMTGGTISLGGATTTIRANNIGGATTLTLTTDTSVGNLFVNTLNPITTPLKLGTTDHTIEIGRVASRTTPISIGNLGLGDGTTAGNIFIGSGSNSSTSSISLGSSSLNENFVRGKTLRLNDGASAVSTIIGNTFTGNTITISAPTTLNRGFLPAYLPSRYSGDDTYLGGYKEATYAPAAPTQSLNTTQQRIVGSISSLLSVGMYQLNVHSTLSSSVLNPYLVFQVYTQTAAAWTNGALRGATGSSVPSLLKVNRNPTTAVADVYTLSLSGLLTVSTSVYLAVVVGNADLTVSQDLTFIDTYLSVTRVG